MSKLELENIKSLLRSAGAEFKVIEHEPVRTSEDAARVRNAPLKAGIKAIVLKERKTGKLVVADIPADKRVDFQAVARAAGLGSLTLASPAEVLEATGCEVGGVPPLGHKNNLPLYVDRGVFENDFNEFNAGLTTTSVRIKSAELKKVFERLGNNFGNFTK